MVKYYSMLVLIGLHSVISAKQLSVRECKEKIGQSATAVLKEVTQVLLTTSATPAPLTSSSVAAMVRMQSCCIEIVEGLLQDDSYWHKVRRSLLQGEAEELLCALNLVESSCKKDKPDIVVSACNQSLEKIASVEDRLKKSLS